MNSPNGLTEWVSCEEPLWQLGWRRRWAGLEHQASAFQVTEIYCHFFFSLKEIDGICPRIYRAENPGHRALTVSPPSSPLQPSPPFYKDTRWKNKCYISHEMHYPQEKNVLFTMNTFQSIAKDFSSGKNFYKIGRSGKMKPDHYHKTTFR